MAGMHMSELRDAPPPTYTGADASGHFSLLAGRRSLLARALPGAKLRPRSPLERGLIVSAATASHASAPSRKGQTGWPSPRPAHGWHTERRIAGTVPVTHISSCRWDAAPHPPPAVPL